MFNACVSLLPVAIAHSNRNESKEAGTSKASHLLSALLDFVNKHIPSADLSPQVAALNVGISVRYVHKLFAARNTTFASYVNLKRLELVRKEMISPLCRNLAISTVAYRCGFNDLSTFNRSFKRHYGVTPREFRADASAARAVDRSVLVGTAAEKASELEHVSR
jgi:AraC-like DNA-binding protein